MRNRLLARRAELNGVKLPTSRALYDFLQADNDERRVWFGDDAKLTVGTKSAGSGTGFTCTAPSSSRGLHQDHGVQVSLPVPRGGKVL